FLFRQCMAEDAAIGAAAGAAASGGRSARMNFRELSGFRPDLAFIAHWVQQGAHVLDLGCGDGVMLDYLQTDKRCTGYGIEIDDAMIPKCIARGVPVIQR